MYQLYMYKGNEKELMKSVKNFDWKRGVPGGWLDYGPPRKVTAYGDGSMYTNGGKKYGKCWKYTSWAASVPYTNTTAVTKTKPIPEDFIKTNILKEVRESINLYGGEVSDCTGTGIWCNYYESNQDLISSHTDDENYYQRNYQDQPLFASLTMYEDGQKHINNLSRFQIKTSSGWQDVYLPHLSILVMSGSVEHRVLKFPKNKPFRKRYNITFRTPVSINEDVIKNFRFFSNFGRYYNLVYMCFVPTKVFKDKIPEFLQLLKYNLKTNKADKYNIIDDGSNYQKVIVNNAKLGPLYLMRNMELDRKLLKEEISKKYGTASNPPNTSTNHSLFILLNQKFL